jgi:hypothetical protein
MKRLVLVFFVSSLLMAIGFLHIGNIPTVEASPSIYQGDLILKGNNVTIIENERFDINGSIIVEENATLVLKNAMMNFTQTTHYEYNMTFRNPASGKPRLLCDSSAITSASSYWFQVRLLQNSSATISNSMDTAYLTLSGFATASVSNSSIAFIDVDDSSVVSVFNSTITTSLQASASPIVTVSNSTIKRLAIWSDSVNCSVANIGPGLFTFWDYHLNSSVMVSPGGYAPNVTFRNSTINYWQLSFQGKSNATIADSTLQYLFSYGNTVVRLVNSTASTIQYSMMGKIYVSWYVDVHVTDSVGQDVPSANVTAAYPNATGAQATSTDAHGWARFTLVEKMTNATGSYPVGNYTVQASYSVYSNLTAVNMAQSQEITLALSNLYVPELPSLLILPLFIIATLAAFVAYKRRPRSHTQSP